MGKQEIKGKNTVMGIEKSNLNENKIKCILEKEYDIIAIDISEINRGTSNIFKIKSDKGKYILKEFTTKRTKDTIIKEVKIINFLRKRKINVPKYVKTMDNKFYIANEGRIIIVQEFIDGYTVESNTGDYKEVIECANILGKLTKELMDFPELSEENIIEYFSKNRIHAGIEKMKQLKKELKGDNKYKKQIEEDIDHKIKISKEIEENFDFDSIKKLTMLNSHGDFCTQQLIYNDKKEPTIIDFEKAKKLPIVWEIMRSYSYIDKEAQDGNINIDTLVDYFKVFTKYIKLNQYDLKYASYIYLLQLVSSIYGYKEYNDDYNQKELLEFAFFRTKLCNFLYEHLEQISSTLTGSII